MPLETTSTRTVASVVLGRWFTEVFHLAQHHFCVEGFGNFVGMLDVIKDGISQLLHTAKTVPADSLLGNFGKEAFYLVEPTAVSWNKMQMPARVLGDPQPPLWSFMCSVIIQHPHDLQCVGMVASNC